MYIAIDFLLSTVLAVFQNLWYFAFVFIHLSVFPNFFFFLQFILWTTTGYLGMCWQFSHICSFHKFSFAIHSWFYFTIIREHTQSFQMYWDMFYGLRMVYPGKCSVCYLRRMCFLLLLDKIFYGCLSDLFSLYSVCTWLFKSSIS